MVTAICCPPPSMARSTPLTPSTVAPPMIATWQRGMVNWNAAVRPTPVSRYSVTFGGQPLAGAGPVWDGAVTRGATADGAAAVWATVAAARVFVAIADRA